MNQNQEKKSDVLQTTMGSHANDPHMNALKNKVKSLHAKQYDAAAVQHHDSEARYVFHYNSNGRRAWDYFIIATAIYSTIVTPLQIVWSPFGKWYDVVDYIIFSFYVLDVFVALRTSFQNILGDEVTNGKAIAVRYIFSLQFLLDILSLLSNPAMKKIPGKASSFLELFSILKVQRFFRFGTMISQSDSRLQIKVLLRILYDIVMLFVYVHITGCCFYWVIKSNPKANWIPPFDYNDGSKSVFYT